jgi:acetyl-CoA carboxylase biotin carboxyl carrier protein
MTNREIKDLMRFFDGSDISKLKIKNGDFSIELQKGFEANSQVNAPVLPTISQAPSQTPEVVVKENVASKPQPMEEGEYIKSPMVGTFYRAPAPGAEPFAESGSVMKKGKVVGIIEAMKIMNEIESEFDCKIVKILVEDGQPVEYDMPLFKVEKL